MSREGASTLRRTCAAAVLATFASLATAQGVPEPEITESTAPAAPPPNAIVEQPRAFGYFVGDLFRQRILLQLDGQAFQPAALPRAERVGNWLERRTLKVEQDDERRRWLVAEFQVINAPQELTATEIPAWDLQPAAESTPLRISAWPITLSPLTSRSVIGDRSATDLRPDRAAPLVITGPMRHRIIVLAGACGATLALWLAWWLWRQWRAASSQPFARALRDMRRFNDAAPEAWHALHRAFDRTAGQALQTATLGELYRRAPHLMPLRDRIEQFFGASGDRFFGGGSPDAAFPVRKFCIELYRLEKRHER